MVIPKMKDDLNLIFKGHSFLHFFFFQKNSVAPACQKLC